MWSERNLVTIGDALMINKKIFINDVEQRKNIMKNKMIFFGNDRCEKKCYRVHKKLEEAFTILGGLQQPPHSDSEESVIKNKRITRDAKQRLEDITKDIVYSLGQKHLLNGDK